jgi:hypothetical protein
MLMGMHVRLADIDRVGQSMRIGVGKTVALDALAAPPEHLCTTANVPTLSRVIASLPIITSERIAKDLSSQLDL